MKITFGSELHNQRSKRSAIVPYTMVKNETKDCYEPWLLLAKHKETGEITDIGGGVKKRESDLDAALRELKEEAHDIFKDVANIEILNYCISVTRPRHEITIKPTNTLVSTESASVTFLPLTLDWLNKAPIMFQHAKKYNKDDELSELIWVKGSDVLQRTSDRYQMWGFVRKFYHVALSDELCKFLYVRWSML